MADIAYANVTFTLVAGRERKTGGVKSLREVEATIAFGNNTLDYPTGGVPITGKTHLGVTEATRACRALGFPEELLELIILDQSANAKGYKFEWDRTNNKILAMVSAGFTPAGTNSAPAFTGTASTSSETITYAPGGGDIKGSANTDQKSADQAGKPTNADLIDTLHAVAAGAWTYSEDLEMPTSRNVCILFKADAAGSTLPTTTTATVTGTFRGAAQTEDIVFDFTAVTSTLTNIAAGQNDLLIGVGIGSKLGLPVDLVTPAEGDVDKIVKNGANLSPSGIVDTTNMTVNLGTLADGDDVAIQFKTLEPAITPAGTVAAPVFTGTAVSAAGLSEHANATFVPNPATLRVIARGY
jgi:hypothetical protein